MKNIKHSERRFLHTFLLSAIVLGIGAGSGYAASAETAAPEAKSDGVVAAVSDTAITAGVQTRLMREDGLLKSKISVTTVNNVVTLEGYASTAKAKALAASAAESVSGVRSVDNQLKVGPQPKSETTKAVDKSKGAVSDSWITTKVKSELLADNVSKSFDVSVKTVKGVVVLSGALTDQASVDHVKSIARKVKGVKSVVTKELIVAAK